VLRCQQQGHNEKRGYGHNWLANRHGVTSTNSERSYLWSPLPYVSGVKRARSRSWGQVGLLISRFGVRVPGGALGQDEASQAFTSLWGFCSLSTEVLRTHTRTHSGAEIGVNRRSTASLIGGQGGGACTGPHTSPPLQRRFPKNFGSWDGSLFPISNEGGLIKPPCSTDAVSTTIAYRRISISPRARSDSSSDVQPKIENSARTPKSAC